MIGSHGISLRVSRYTGEEEDREVKKGLLKGEGEEEVLKVGLLRFARNDREPGQSKRTRWI